MSEEEKSDLSRAEDLIFQAHEADSSVGVEYNLTDAIKWIWYGVQNPTPEFLIEVAKAQALVQIFGNLDRVHNRLEEIVHRLEDIGDKS